MKFIELRPGVNISSDGKICVESIDMMTCKVTTSVGVYESIYPSWRILMQLEQDNIEESINPDAPVDRVNLWGRQYFAG